MFDESPLARLEDEITTLAAHLNAATARWLELVGEYDRREGWAAWGCKSCADWLSWRCGISPVTAREQLRVARSLAELLEVRREFAAGRFSYSQVRALTRVATPAIESQLVEIARHCTAAQLDRLTRGYRNASEQLEEAAEAGDRRCVEWWEDRGTLVIQARLPVAEGEAVLNALHAVNGRLDAEEGQPVENRADDSAEAPRDRAESDADDSAEAPRRPAPWARMADALVAMAEAALAGDDLGIARGARHELVVHVDVETLSHDAPGRCETGDGRAIAPEVARRLGCDGGLVGVRHRDGRPLSVGRRMRAIPAHIRRALQARDGCCRFPGCHQRRHLDSHHIRHWASGGHTSEANLLLLCRHHHRLLHEGGYTLRRREGGRLAFHRPDGRRIHEVPRRPDGHPRGPARGNHAAAIGIDRTTAVTGWTGEHLDVAFATTLLCHTRLRN